MHQTRARATKKLQVPRKGTKYLVRPMSHVRDSVPLVIAIRDMLKLARTTKEVKAMIHDKALKINWKEATDYREAIKLFNLLEADDCYVLTHTKNGRFMLEKTSQKSERLVKVVGKKMLKNKAIQLNFHDGSNTLSKEKTNMDDTIYLDSSGKIVKHVSFEKGKKCTIISGKYTGLTGVIFSVEGKEALVKLNDGGALVTLKKRSIIVI